MGRSLSLTENGSATLASDALYGPANELTQLSYEGWTGARPGQVDADHGAYRKNSLNRPSNPLSSGSFSCGKSSFNCSNRRRCSRVSFSGIFTST